MLKRIGIIILCIGVFCTLFVGCEKAPNDSNLSVSQSESASEEVAKSSVTPKPTFEPTASETVKPRPSEEPTSAATPSASPTQNVDTSASDENDFIKALKSAMRKLDGCGIFYTLGLDGINYEYSESEKCLSVTSNGNRNAVEVYLDDERVHTDTPKDNLFLFMAVAAAYTKAVDSSANRSDDLFFIAVSDMVNKLTFQIQNTDEINQEIKGSFFKCEAELKSSDNGFTYTVSKRDSKETDDDNILSAATIEENLILNITLSLKQMEENGTPVTDNFEYKRDISIFTDDDGYDIACCTMHIKNVEVDLNSYGTTVKYDDSENDDLKLFLLVCMYVLAEEEPDLDKSEITDIVSELLIGAYEQTDGGELSLDNTDVSMFKLFDTYFFIIVRE